MKQALASWLRSQWVTPSSGRHWDYLDGLRGMAILMVVFGHSFYYSSPHDRFAGWPRFAHAFMGAGHLGVQVFFVLSGFLISQPFFAAKYKNAQNWYPEGYVVRRFLKIIPPYYLTILVLSIFYCWRDQGLQQVKYGLLWLFGIPDFIYVPNAMEFNFVFWSLWVEVGFYVLLPLFFLLLLRCSYWRTGLIISLFLLIVPFLTRQLIPLDPTHGLYNAAQFPNGLTNFSWGVLFACFYTTTRQNSSMKQYAVIGYVGVFLLLITMLLDTQYFLIQRKMSFEVPWHLSGFSAFLSLFFIFDAHNLGTRFFSMPWLRYIGLVSYEWFLLHLPAVEGFRQWMGHPTASLGRYFFVAIVPMAVTFILSGLVYQYFSTPIIKWGRTRLTRPQPVA